MSIYSDLEERYTHFERAIHLLKEPGEPGDRFSTRSGETGRRISRQPTDGTYALSFESQGGGPG
jgi:hypothetical protein